MAALQAAEVERRLRFPEEFRDSRHGAILDGFSLHAGVRIHGNDRDGRERRCRYLLRPPLSLRRLSQGKKGRLVYRMKRPPGGSLFLLLTPDELLARLATLVPPPRVHGLRYHGVFAPSSRVRRRVVPAAPDPVPAAPETPARMTEEPLQAKPAKMARKYRVPRADGLAAHRLHRPGDGREADPRPPPVARAALPPEQVDLGPSNGATDPIYPE